MSSEETDDNTFDPLYCARLYNTIIRTGFHKIQRAQKGSSLRRNWFKVFSADPNLEACRDAIPSPLVPFLEAIEIVVGSDGRPNPRDVLLHHLQAIPPPTRMFITYRDTIGDCLVLFPYNLTEPTCLGILMEPGLLITYASNEECFFPHDENRYWRTLPDLLERLLKMIFIGKYCAVPFNQVDPYNNPFCEGSNCWEVIPWNEYILNQTLEAYEGLVEAITSRVPSSHVANQQQPATTPIATEDTLPPEIKGFPRAFLLNASKPRFHYIAPGLTVYDPANPPLTVRVNPETQYIDHPYRELSCHQAEHDPLVLFPSLVPPINKSKQASGSSQHGAGQTRSDSSFHMISPPTRTGTERWYTIVVIRTKMEGEGFDRVERRFGNHRSTARSSRIMGQGCLVF